MTFTLGLAAVWMANVFSIVQRDYPVAVPSVVSEDVLYVFPIEERRIPRGRGSHFCGRSTFDPVLRKKRYH